MSQTTAVLNPNSEGIRKAVEILEQGGCVAFPTETVYGLGADARQDAAVAAIYEAKGRPSFNPLIVHVSDIEAAASFVEITPEAQVLSEALWPGPITFVLPQRSDTGISKLVSAGMPSLAIRAPDAPVAQSLLKAFGGPIAAPSANRSGRISPTTADHVIAGLSGRIAAVLDGGHCSVGLESTIVDLTGTPRIIRPGGVPSAAISAVLNAPIESVTPEPSISPNAPGQLASHYAPRAHLKLNMPAPEGTEPYLGFGPGPDASETLSATGDLREAAANLFAALHRLDKTGAAYISVAPIPETGLGVAINDRLRRAAAPRDQD